MVASPNLYHFRVFLLFLSSAVPWISECCLYCYYFYTNIPHGEGIEACRKSVNSSGHLSRSHLKTESICDLMRMIQTMNNFQFDNNYYIQLHETAMGTRMALVYRNLFMDDLERKLLVQSPLKTFHLVEVHFDIFMVWTHEEDKLNEFITH